MFAKDLQPALEQLRPPWILMNLRLVGWDKKSWDYQGFNT